MKLLNIIVVLAILGATTAERVPATVSKSQVNLPCVLCEAMLNVVHEKLPSNYQEWQLLQTMMTGCDALPKLLRPECQVAAVVFEDEIFDVLTEKTPPQQACAAINVCNSAVADKEVAAVTADVPCVICEFALQEIAKSLPANFTEPELETILKGVCSKLPKTVEPECNILVALYGDKIYDAIEGKTSPEQVCTGIDLCHNSTLSKVQEVAVFQPKADVPCILCEFALQEIAQSLPANFTETELETALDEVCSKLPKTISPECKILVALYGDKIYDAIEGKTPPGQVCTTLDLCHNTTTAIATVKEPSADILCSICEFSLYLVNLSLPVNYTEQELDQQLKAVCDDIPKTLAPECNIFMGLYEDKIFNAITGEVPREEVCTNIKACKSSQNLLAQSRPTESQTYRKGNKKVPQLRDV